ncbi:uncharacterized protein EV154DRAFT_576017 [Mucor mucedo]|uniref:uncharacterized protein n=1 Tax=Mucor mucedo TaxID=29922 RepID=UPI0022204D22|nr:uncharacterized protein EV154DRAFT_576017 [Mucor mucedo]KAI7895027.1 hypothetical protein EV154DRAFT_576017 [Mucor mucedo]
MFILILPSEIREVIFSSLEVKDVLQCQLTCKSWSGPATQRIIYKNIDGLMKRKDNVKHFIETISTSSSGCGEFVKFLDVRVLFSKKYITAEMMETIGKFCPNVERISGYDTDDLFCACITYGRNLGYWKHIQQLPSVSYVSNFTAEVYYDSILACAGSLQTLELNLSNHFVGNEFCVIKNTIINNIRLFSSLKHIQLKKIRGEISNLDDIVSHCSISVDSISISHCNDRQSAISSIKNLEVLPNNNIKHLELDFCNLNQNSIQYLIQKFSGIQQLNISSSWDGFIELNSTFKRNFFRYMSSIPKFTLSGVTNVEGEKMCMSLITYVSSSLANATRKHNTINASISYHYDCYSRLDNLVSNLSVAQSKKTYYDEPSIIDISLKFYSHTRNLNRSRTIMNEYLWKQCGSKLSRISVCPNIQEYDDEYPKRPVHSYMIDRNELDIILENCTSLIELEIGRTNISYSSLHSSGKPNKSISTLKLSGCWFAPSILTGLSIRLPSLAHLTIANCVFLNTPRRDRLAQINMPNTCFQSINLVWSHDHADIWKKHDTFHVKVSFGFSTIKRDIFFCGDQTQIKKSTAVKYRVAILECMPFEININCKDISNFSIKIEKQRNIFYDLRDINL